MTYKLCGGNAICRHRWGDRPIDIQSRPHPGMVDRDLAFRPSSSDVGVLVTHSHLLRPIPFRVPREEGERANSHKEARVHTSSSPTGSAP